MLSRRNVRIKVMQMLYALSRDKGLTFDEVMARYRQSVNLTFDLYLFNLLLLIRLAEYAHQDVAKRRAKLRPSEEDKQFNAKLADNALLQSLAQNEGLQRLLKQRHFQYTIDEDTIRLLYLDFAKQESYKLYVLDPSSTAEDHCNQLLALFKNCVASETYQELMEDNFSNWVDDESLIVGAMKKTIKALPATAFFFEEYKPGHEATVEFGEVLLRKVYEEDESLLAMIEPALKNWDAERVAVIDMILIKMALCELVSFPTIPAKVTLNEFVEISKLYSTEKSKDFINGILDRLMKKLHSEGKIHKEGRGLLDE